MRTLAAGLTLAALAFLAGCGSTPGPGASAFDPQYEYGFYAGTDQRPDLYD